jgi:DNA-directed RNA polymerase specialized sigma24 family protein
MASLDTRLTCYQPTRRQLASWASRDPALAGRSFAGIRRQLLDDATSYAVKDTVLAAFIRVSRTDPDATAAVVACLLPGLRARVRRYGGRLQGPEGTAVMAAALVRQIGRYRLDRHPQRIAHTLLWRATGTLRDTRDREDAWAAHARLGLTADDLLVDDHEPAGAAILALAVDAGAISADDAWLIDATRLGGYTLTEAAKGLGIGYEATKKRRQRAQAALAAWWTTNVSQEVVT